MRRAIIAATFGGLLTAGVIVALAAPASADDPTSWGEAHSSMICSSWKANPSYAGLVSLVNSITSKTGFTQNQAAQAIGAGAAVGCPDEVSGIEAIAAQHPNG
jgi:hypothetical protein